MRVEQVTANQVRKTLAATVNQIDADIRKMDKSTNPITRMQAEAQRAALRGYMAHDWEDIEADIAAGRKTAAREASKVVSTYENTLLQMVMDEDAMKALARAEAQRAVSGVDAAVRRMQGKSYVPLSKQVYDTAKLADGWVDDTINRALAAGWSQTRLAKALKDSIDPMVPGGVSYAANRTARTEVNNAFHASAAKRYEDSPIVEGVDWHLSSSHPEGDVCDSLADGSPYPKNKVPQKPHPHCYCFLTPALPTDEEFIEKLFNGDYGDGKWATPPKVDRTKVDTAYQLTNFQLNQSSITKLRNLEAEHTQSYHAYVKALKGSQEALYEDAVYKSLNAYRIKVRDILRDKDIAANAKRTAAAKARAEAKKAAATSQASISKLPTMSKPATMKDAYQGGRANPKGWRGNRKDTPEYDYNINCTRVSASVEMRMRGFDVSAQKAGRTADKSDQAIQNNWIDRRTKRPRPLKRVETAEMLESRLLKEGEGARFFVVGSWKSGGAHIWNAEVKGGRVIYHEGQTSANFHLSGTEALTKHYNSRLDWDTPSPRNAVRYLRVDDMDPVDSLITNDWIVPKP
jgi:hypothetical protein